MDKVESILPRGLHAVLEEALQDTPVVCLLGPRQSGKSTLAQHLAPDRAYIDLDDDDLAQTALTDPSGFVRSLPNRVGRIHFFNSTTTGIVTKWKLIA